jgi:hypothetical protein
MEMLAVVGIDGERIGSGQPGLVFRDLYAAYRTTVRRQPGKTEILDDAPRLERHQ